MKKKLIVLSDLWGSRDAQWLSQYESVLKSHFTLVYYDCCELGEINTTPYTQEHLHTQFVEGGIQKAVANLLTLETEPISILAFSVGGTIAWQFGMASDIVETLVCVSSTRLRKETHQPQTDIMLYYGAEDPFIPESSWLERMTVRYTMIPNQGHLMYKDPKLAKSICAHLTHSN